MKLLIPTIKKFLPGWNQLVHTESDAYEFCEKNRIVTLDSENIDDLGEYRIRRETPVIVLHKFLSSRYRNLVLHHEIGHFILHPTTAAKFSDEVQKRKIEREANFVAAVAMLPRWIFERKNLAEIADEFNVPHKIILFRKWIFDNCGF